MLPLLLMLLLLLPHMMQLSSNSAIISLGSTVSEFELPKLDPSKLPDDVEVDWVKAWK